MLVVEQMPDARIHGDLCVGQRRLPGREVLRRHDPVDRAPLDQDRHREGRELRRQRRVERPGDEARHREPLLLARGLELARRARRAAAARPRSSPRS